MYSVAGCVLFIIVSPVWCLQRSNESTTGSASPGNASGLVNASTVMPDVAFINNMNSASNTNTTSFANQGSVLASVIANASTGAPQTLLSASQGHCSSADEATIKKAGPGNADGTFPHIVMECGTHSYRWFRFSEDRYERCTQDKLLISASCSRCFTPPAQYMVRHCKMTCIRHGWCSHECVSCGEPTKSGANSCAGFRLPETAQCD
jgi:hypothetical protein